MKKPAKTGHGVPTTMGFFDRFRAAPDPRDSVITHQAKEILDLREDNAELREELRDLHRLGREAVEFDMNHEQQMKSIEVEAIRIERAAEVAEKTGVEVDGVEYAVGRATDIPGGDSPEPVGEDLPS